MRVPGPLHAFADYSGGSIRITDGAGGCKHLTLAEAYALHLSHLTSLKAAALRGDHDAHDFHACWERSLRLAIAEGARVGIAERRAA